MVHKRKNERPFGSVNCGWCGRSVALSNKQLAMPHNNGASQCMGSGQPKASHNFLQKSHAEARAAGKKT